eukprot:scaffold1089_cov117-Cylindrotheca_fusiformis.AAC.5
MLKPSPPPHLQLSHPLHTSRSFATQFLAYSFMGPPSLRPAEAMCSIQISFVGFRLLLSNGEGSFDGREELEASSTPNFAAHLRITIEQFLAGGCIPSESHHHA